VLYHVQIYCDFSGYTDMAIAVAGLLGYTLPRNFDFPYLAASARDFGRRWHMAVTRWFRDYLYISLGGNRGSRLETARNLVTVFLLCGLWHGAAFRFVVWGAVHGALLVLERSRWGGFVARWPRALGVVYVNVAVMLAWVPFRAPDLQHAGRFLAGMFALAGAPSPELARTAPLLWALALPALLAAHLMARRRLLPRAAESLPDWGFAAAYGFTLALVFPWVATAHLPFIYFQF
jgi:alginate O-acetyltransferase complex protein AlgI